MNKFANLKFNVDPDGVGIRTRVQFKNGYGASIVKHERSYGGNEGLYELAVLKNDRICYDTEITQDVLGWLSEAQVEDTLNRIQNLPNIP